MFHPGADRVNYISLVIFQQALVNDNNDEALCVFWDLSLKEGRGDWSNAGCELHGLISGRYTCHCYHLANFAVLLVC